MTGLQAAPRVTSSLTVKYKGRTYPVASLEDAAAKWEQFRLAEIYKGGGGCSQIGNGVTVRDSSGRIVGRVSYNSRIWPTARAALRLTP